jgi:endo-1,4-beta-xylanase
MIKKFLLVLSAFLFFNAATCENKTADLQNIEIQPLKEVYKNYFLIGNIINPRYMSSREHLKLIETHFNTVTCENDMKPDHLAPRVKGESYRWETADYLVNSMLERNIKVHGHTLVWYSQTHKWMTEGTKEQVKENMINHINTVLAHFKGRVFSWDVINEAFADGSSGAGDWKKSLRTNSGWYQALGEDYVELAYRTARAADPDLLLYYNDYGLNNASKASAVRNMVKDINDRYRAEGNNRGLIDGVGMQGHYGLDVLIPDVRASIEKFIALGVKVDISELDIEDKQTYRNWGTGKSGVMASADAATQARKYGQLFLMLRQYNEHITRVTMWGLDDDTNWKSIGNPCLFDGKLNPKKSFFAVLAAGVN